MFKAILSFSAALLCTAAWPAEFWKMKPGQSLQWDGRSCNFTLWTNNWTGVGLNGRTIRPTPGKLQKDKAGHTLEAKVVLPAITAAYTEELRILSPEKVRVRIALAFPQKTKIDTFSAIMLFPYRFWNETPVLLNGQPVPFQPGSKNRAVGNVSEIRIPGQGGTVVLSGLFDVLLVDCSRTSYAPDSLQIRIMPRPCAGTLSSVSIEMEAAWIPEKARPVDLRKAMNMGFRDDLPEDGKGGWTDQGASNDLRSMLPGARTMDNVFFDVTDPLSNNGKSCIVLRGKQREYFPDHAEADFSDTPSAHFLYVLHATAWDAPKGTDVGRIRCIYTDGTEEVLPVKSKIHTGNFWYAPPLPEAAVGWRGENDAAALGLYITRYPVKHAPLRKIRFESANTSVWMIVAASLSDSKIKSAIPHPKMFAADGETWLPLTGDPYIKAGTLLDLSARLDAPAGKYGFAKNAGGKIVFEHNPVPMRFYGANLCFDANYLENRTDIDRMADDFARIGYNLVRLHHFDRDLTDYSDPAGTGLKKEILDRFDYTLAAFKKRGIYVVMDTFINRNIPKGKIPGYPNGLARGEYKALVWADPACRNNFLSFSENLLRHVNPYTGTAWKDEPAIININLVNEDAVCWTSNTPAALPVYDKFFQSYVRNNHIAFSQYEQKRIWNLFLSEFYPNAFRSTVNSMRAFGVRQMLCDQNHSTDILTMLTREPYDIVENHVYWGHPAFLNGSWGGPALVCNLSAISKFGGPLCQMFRTRAINKPFSLTEWDFCNPNPHNAEGAFLMGAYGALQDWNAFCRFAYSHKKAIFAKKTVPDIYFDIANDPVRRLSEIAGILFFLRGDIKSSDITIPLLLNRRHFALPGAPAEPGILPERIGLIAKTGNVIFDPEHDTLRSLPNMNAAIYTDTASAAWTAGKLNAVSASDHLDAIAKLEKERILPSGSANTKTGAYRSSTGELELNPAAVTFQAVSPRSEGFLMEPNRSMHGKFTSASNRKSFCALLCAAMDGKTLPESTRYLILHLTDTKNTGMTFSDEDMRVFEKAGTRPILIRRGLAELTLNRECGGFRLYPLALDGSRLAPRPFTSKNGKTILALDTAHALAWELVRE